MSEMSDIDDHVQSLNNLLDSALRIVNEISGPVPSDLKDKAKEVYKKLSAPPLVPSSPTRSSMGSISIEEGSEHLIDKPVISARSCVVCGRSDRPGSERKSGFKCFDCVGVASNQKYKVQVQQEVARQKGVDDDGNKTINDYVFMYELGRGAYGKVKMAAHNVSGQAYAVKILKKDQLKKVQSGGDSALATIKKEIQIMVALKHPNLCKLYEIIEDSKNGKLYLVMEYLAGGQLFSVEEKTGRCFTKRKIEGNEVPMLFPRERLKKYVVAVCNGLEYLHFNKVIHRDIKPENICVDSEDHAKLVDFGVSSVLGRTTNKDDDCTGSPAYMSPEAIAQKAVDYQTDVWALGVTLYGMIFGNLPFWTSNVLDLPSLVVDSDLENQVEHEDPAIQDLLRKMLTKDPNTRITVPGILKHPFLVDVRTVRGQPVETETIKLDISEDQSLADSHAALIEKKDYIKSLPANQLKGWKGFSQFVKKHGPNLQVHQPNAFTLMVFGIKNE